MVLPEYDCVLSLRATHRDITFGYPCPNPEHTRVITSIYVHSYTNYITHSLINFITLKCRSFEFYNTVNTITIIEIENWDRY